MPDTPLQQLQAHGQSVWIDYLSRPFVEDGELAGLVRDGVTGVTSNPTIFQGAIADGDAYDEQLREVLQTETDPKEVFLALARQRHPRAPATLLQRSLGRAAAPTATAGSRSRSTPTWPTTPRRTIAEAKRLHELVDRPNLFVKIPATEAGLPAIEETIAARHPGQRDADLLARAPPRGGRGLHPRPASGWSTSGGDPRADRVGRLVLRLARRHRGRQAPRRDRRPRRAQGQAGDRQREARLPDLQGGLLRAPSGRRSRPRARSPQRCLWASTSTKNPDYRDVLYVEELIGPRHGQHDAARDRRGVPGPRRASRDTLDEDVDGAARTLEAFAAGRASTTTTSSQTLEREGVEKFAKSLRGAVRGRRGQARRAGGGMSSRLPKRARPAAARRLGPRQRRRRLGPPDLVDVGRRPDGRAARRRTCGSTSSTRTTRATTT